MNKITIKITINEQDLIEGLLNMYYSGVELSQIHLTLGFYALANRWHISKLIYYTNLFEVGE